MNSQLEDMQRYVDAKLCLKWFLTLVEGLGPLSVLPPFFFLFSDLSEIGTALPEIKTPLPEIKTALPEIDIFVL